MKKAKITLFVLFAIVLSCSWASAQTGSENLWLDHLPYTNCKAVAEADNLIYVATPSSVFYFNKTDNSLNRLNKVSLNGLSDIGISAIAYCSKLNTLVVAYSNTNLDLVKGSTVVNIPDIKRKQILGNKTINSILVIDKLAYLSCGFGIVVLDIEKEEIKDTYYIGPSGSQIDVKSLTYHQTDNKFYAATEKGIYSALATTNLAYYINWVKDVSITGPNDNFNLVASFSDKVYANKTRYTWDSDSMFVFDGAKWNHFMVSDLSNRTAMRVTGDRLVVSSWRVQTFKPDGTLDKNYQDYNPGTMKPYDAIIDKSGIVWIADIERGLWAIGADLVGSNYVFKGPASPTVAAMDISGKQLWVVQGGRTPSFTNLYRVPPEFYTLADNSWVNFNTTTTPEITGFYDILCVAADPTDANHAFLGTWGLGLIEFDNGVLKEIYNPTNSSLDYFVGYGVGYCRIGGVAFDNNNNLWATNSSAPNVLSMRKPTGEWKSFNLGSLGTAIDVGGLVVDQENQKWMQLRDLALFVFSENGTPDNPADDKKQKLTNALGNGNLPGGIASMAVDREGQLWLGTDQGVAVIYSPGNVFTGGNYDAQRIMVEEAGYLHPLLETEAITAIAVNGNNEKWLGTDKSGVFLMSADGTEELLHFTEANSPLLSNSIQSIKIASNGEVYFGTSLGIVSYKDYKVEPPSTLDSLFIYPNPVRPEYKGPIYISNLVAESNVKITDISGALIWEIQAQGGQVIWDGQNLEGKQVKTGMYLVFVTNPDGTQKKVGKVLFVR
jgi:hypothetical protein